MAVKPVCYIIGPIGQPDSDTRRDADDLLELVIRPALEKYDFEVVRGDHSKQSDQIHEAVRDAVRSADLCIADISKDNVNVYYEVGRRMETEKPIFFLRYKQYSSNGDDAAQKDNLPVDLGTQRVIYFDLDSRAGIRRAKEELSGFVAQLDRNGMERKVSASLGGIAAVLERVERKLDQISKDRPVAAAPIMPDMSSGKSTDPREVFLVARKQNNIALMEQMLDQLQVSMDKWKWLDFYVEVAAARGSVKAGEIMLKNASDFIDESTMSFKKKIEYLGCLVSFLNRADRELEYLDLVEKLCDRLYAVSEGEDSDLVAQIFNQRNRLYHGIYDTTEDVTWLEKAIQQLERASEIEPNEVYIHYNLAVCYSNIPSRMDDARNAIDRVLAKDEANGEADEDHLRKACQIYRDLDDPRYGATLEKLRKINPYKAMLLEMT